MLTGNRRCDSKLFELYSSICRGGAQEHERRQYLVAEARHRFLAQGSTTGIQWHQAISNANRLNMSEENNAYEAARYEADT